MDKDGIEVATMKYDQAGTYHLHYTAVDECGNETTQTRTIEVEGAEPQYITLLDISNYTAPNNTPMAKTNEWDFSKGSELVVEATGVIVDGSVSSGIFAVYFDGFTSDPSVAVLLEYMPEAYEDGSGVWFMSDLSDSTKFTSTIVSEGSGEQTPSTVSFERLIVKQKVEV